MSRIFPRETIKERTSGYDVGLQLADVLPYLFINPESNVHILEDGGLGCAWRFDVPQVENVDNGYAVVSNALSAIINAVPPGYTMQIISTRNTNIRRYVKRYVSGHGYDDLSRMLMKGMATQWLNAQRDGFFPNEPDAADKLFPVSQGMIITLRSPPSGVLGDPGFMESLLSLVAPGGTEKRANDRLQAIVSRFRKDCDAIQSAAKASSWMHRRMDGAEFLQVMQEILFPDRDMQRPPPAVARFETLSESVGTMGDITFTKRGAITSYDGSETHHHIVSMLWQPDGVEPGMMVPVLTCGGNVVAIVTVTGLSNTVALAKIKAKAFMASRMASSLNAMSTRAKIDSINEVEARYVEGERLAKVRLTIIAQASTERAAEDKASIILNMMRSAGNMESIAEEEIGASLLRDSLPLSGNPQTIGMMQRTRLMLSRDIADLVPAGGAWAGTTSSSLVMYVSRSGTPFMLDTRKSETNPHFLVIGGSGSGKSFWVHDLIAQLWRLPDLRVYLISIKPDYIKLAHTMGKYVPIDLDNPVSINPFGGAPTPENQEFWSAVLGMMIVNGSHTETVANHERLILGAAAINAATANWNQATNDQIRETLLDDIVNRLQVEHGDAGRDLARRLAPYHSGQYQGLFNAPRSIAEDDRLVFFNLANMAETSASGVVTFCLFSFINRIMYKTELRGTLKVLGLDEGWALLSDNYASQIIGKAFRAYRSLGGMVFAVTQNITDLDSPTGKVILGSTASKVILRQQSASAIGDIKRHIALNRSEEEMVAGLQIKKRQFSEFFVKMDSGDSTVARVIPDVFKYALATTDSGDEALFNELLAECRADPSLQDRPYEHALRLFVERHGFGR